MGKATADTYALDEGPGFVYVMERAGHLKIGLSTDPEKRLRQIQTASPEPIALIATRQFANRLTAAAAERLLHKRFARKRHVGEWFNAEKHRVLAALQGSTLPECHHAEWHKDMPYEVGCEGTLSRWKWRRDNLMADERIFGKRFVA